MGRYFLAPLPLPLCDDETKATLDDMGQLIIFAPAYRHCIFLFEFYLENTQFLPTVKLRLEVSVTCSVGISYRINFLADMASSFIVNFLGDSSYWAGTCYITKRKREKTPPLWEALGE